MRWRDRFWTYADAWATIERIAAPLAYAGQPSSYRIAGYLDNSPDAVWLWFGVLRAGASYVALNREHKGLLLRDMVQRSGARLIVTDTGGLEELERVGLRGQIPIALIQDAMLQDAASGRMLADRDLQPVSRCVPTSFAEAGVIYTSGSTGRSKAVRLSHAALTRGAGRVVEAYCMNSKDVFHAWLPHFHIAGQLHQSLATVVAGGQIALFPTFSASQFWSQIRSTGATIVVGLPNVVNIIWRQLHNRAEEVSTLRLWLTTNINHEIQGSFEARFGVQLLEQYGMTEAELITLPRAGERVPVGSCGKPGPDWELAIVDDADRRLPPGKKGEIVIRPRVPGILMLGYLGDDEATIDALRNAWFHCGDFGYQDAEGYLYFVSRRKDVIRRRGENISIVELEHIIATHPAISECAAVPVPSAMGEDDVKVVVSLREGEKLSPKELHTYCHKNMARFMVPRFIRVVQVMPRTSVGKVDKEDLRMVTDDDWDAEKEIDRSGDVPAWRQGS